MDLLQLLMGTLTSKSSVKSVSKKTGVSSSLVTKLLIAAVPLLIKYMTQNASKKEGALSLLGALGQHKDTTATSQQIANADTEDGAKIISKILGGDEKQVVSSLAKETGVTKNQASSILSTIAPSVLSSLSAATTSASKVDLSDGLDLSDVMGLLSGASASSQKKSSSSSLAGNLLGSLLGGGTTQTQKKQSSGLDVGNLMGALFGGGTQQQQVQQTPQSNGTELLSLLTSLMK